MLLRQHRPTRTRRTATVLIALAATASLAACTGPDDADPSTPGDATSAEAPAPAPAARIAVKLPDNAKKVPYTHPLRVRVADGDLDDVTLTARGSGDHEGRVRGNGAWAPVGYLLPGTRYRLVATATNADGEQTRVSRRFTTANPEVTDLPAVTPLTDSTVGVGHPVIVYFDHDVADQAAVEDQLSVDTSRPVKGSWGWIDDRTVAYRPKTFWPAYTDVTVHVDLAKTRLSGQAWVMEDRTISFRVGRSQVMRISDTSHDMDVIRDGKTIRTVPVSMGKAGFTTRSGTKVIMTREVSRRMDSATVSIGGSEAYDLEVPYAMRITSTGEFIHGAPWSEWAQGSQNVSHGCTNVSLANAIWIYENALIGDPVITTGTGRPTEEWNGLGGIWNFSWREWQDRSAD